MKIISLLISLLFLFSQSSFASTYQDKNTKVEQAILNTMKVFNIPGVAVAIVEDDKVVFNKGFGVKEYDKPDIVTTDTLFGIASNTKGMTVALLAQLVDQYKISWQTKVIDILPEFRLYNASVTEDFTLIDLLSHRSGLGFGAGDLMIWPNRSHTDKYIFDGLQYLPQMSGFRTQFAYSNIMYVIAGKVIEKITNKSWHQNIQERIFTPIGMTSSAASFSLLTENTKANLAVPHLYFKDTMRSLESNYLTDFSSAGSVLSNVNDMTKWIKALLNKGQINNHKPKQDKFNFNLGNLTHANQLFSEAQANVMWQPHIYRNVSSNEVLQDNTHFSAYGLGWFLKDFYGNKLVHHSGGITGMVSKVLLIPEKKLGVVILTNQNSSVAINAIYREIFEAYIGLPEKDWVSIYSQQEQKDLTRDKSRLSNLKTHLLNAGNPPFALKTYAQSYSDKWYGDIIISLNNNKLRIEFSHTPQLKGELYYYQDNTFVIKWDNQILNADAYIKFNLSEDGNIIEAKLKPVSYLTDFSFNFQDLTLVPNLKTKSKLDKTGNNLQ